MACAPRISHGRRSGPVSVIAHRQSQWICRPLRSWILRTNWVLRGLSARLLAKIARDGGPGGFVQHAKFRFWQNVARIDGHIAIADLKVHVRAGRVSGVSEQSHQSTLRDLIALFDLEFAVMRI